MTNLNGTTYKVANSVGLNGGGKSPGTGNSAGGGEAAQSDVQSGAFSPVQVNYGTSNGQNGSTGLISLGDLAQTNAAVVYDQSGNAVNNYTAQGLRVSSQNPYSIDD